MPKPRKKIFGYRVKIPAGNWRQSAARDIRLVAKVLKIQLRIAELEKVQFVDRSIEELRHLIAK